MKKYFLLLVMVCSLPAVAAEPAIYQAGTLLNLMHGIYAGSTTFAELAKQGNMGLGTTNGLGGELVEIDDKFYLGDVNGNARQITPDEKTPLAIVTHFSPQQQFNLPAVSSLADFENQLDKRLPSKNIFYVIRVDGKFSTIKARSAPVPSEPYPPLDQWLKAHQNIFYLHNIDGSIVIFKSPDFIAPISVPGYHPHFISADRKKAGHVFDFKITDAKVSVEAVHDFRLMLPDTKEYSQANLSGVSSQAITEIESKK